MTTLDIRTTSAAGGCGFAEPMTPMIGGKPALLSGTVEKLTDNWLVLRGQTKTYWIPVNAILMVEVNEK